MRLALSALAVSLSLAGPASAETAVDLLFETPHLAEVRAGSTLAYRVTTLRKGQSAAAEHGGGTITMTTEAVSETDGRTVTTVIERDGHRRELDPFHGMRANPIIMIFLERIVRDVAKESGGSPFYLRNRFREALGTSMTQTQVDGGNRLAFQPLVGDPNAARLGALAGLDVSFVIDPALPGMFRALRARAGSAEAPVFLEEVIYDAQN